VEALMDFNAVENAVSFETVKDCSKLKIYEFRDGKTSSTWRFGALGVVWLPVVIGSRSDKLRCVVVDGLVEKLIIGLPGLSFLGASVNFATGDVRIQRRRRKKVEGDALAKKGGETHEVHALVRDAEMKCKRSKGIKCSRVEPSKKSPGRNKECIKKQSSEQVKDLAGKDGLHDDDRDIDKHKTPNPMKEKDPVSGRGEKDEVNVVSPRQEILATTTPDHGDEISEGVHESEEEEDSKQEELEQCGDRGARVDKQAQKTKIKKGKKNRRKSKKGKKKGKK